ncbi:hypothetical protein ACFL38_02725 [Candidatus Omnitrophota bacterium]
MKRLVLIAICLAFTATLIGCGTMKGLGEDITAVGGWFVKGSDEVSSQ